MLELARRNTSDFDNIRFHRDLDGVIEELDFVNSFIVLQHIRPVQGMSIIKQLMSQLRPGGVFALHVTTGDRRRLRGVANWMRYRIPALQWCYNLARRRPISEPITEMNSYIPFEILYLAEKHGFDGAYVKPIDQNGHRGLLFFGKKKICATQANLERG